MWKIDQIAHSVAPPMLTTIALVNFLNKFSGSPTGIQSPDIIISFTHEISNIPALSI